MPLLGCDGAGLEPSICGSVDDASPASDAFVGARSGSGGGDSWCVAVGTREKSVDSRRGNGCRLVVAVPLMVAAAIFSKAATNSRMAGRSALSAAQPRSTSSRNSAGNVEGNAGLRPD